MMNEMDNFYHDLRLARLQLCWGEGYLSPGGDADVRAIVDGLQLEEKRVLDIGCGVGGPSMLLASEFGAQVTAVDVSNNVISKAKALANSRGASDRLIFQVIEKGPLPFDNESFDFVFSKDALTHIDDKLSLFEEIGRVLASNGRILLSDWLYSSDAGSDPAFKAWMGDEADAFKLETIADIEELLSKAGFTEIASVDMNGWFVNECREENAKLRGTLRSRGIEIMGEADYDEWLEFRDLLEAAAVSGAVRPAHVRAVWKN